MFVKAAISKNVRRWIILAGISLSTYGFGMGNFNDVLLEQLADKGHGMVAYVDTIDETQRLFIDNLTKEHWTKCEANLPPYIYLATTFLYRVSEHCHFEGFKPLRENKFPKQIYSSGQ